MSLSRNTKSNILRKITVAVTFLLVIPIALSRFVSPPLVRADSSPSQLFSVSPVIINLTLSPGKVINYSIRVENLLDNPLPIRAQIEDASASDEDYGIQIAAANESPLSQWISFVNPDAILPPKTAHDFAFTITTPPSIPLGGYFAMISFSPLSPTAPVSSKVAALILGNLGVAGQTHTAQLLDFRFDHLFYNPLLLFWPIKKGNDEGDSFFFNPQASFLLRIRNTSLNYFTAKPKITLTPLFGRTFVFDFEDKVIFPDKVRRWQNSLPGNLPIGLYTVQLTVSLEQGQFISGSTRLVVFPIRIFLLILVSIISLTLLVKYRSRWLRAVTILINGH